MIAQSRMQNGSPFSIIDFFASEHRLDLRGEIRVVRQVQEQTIVSSVMRFLE